MAESATDIDLVMLTFMNAPLSDWTAVGSRFSSWLKHTNIQLYTHPLCLVMTVNR